MDCMKKTFGSKHQAGFTLTEVMISLALAGIVMGAVYSAFQSQQSTYKTQDQVAEMQQNVRAGLHLMVQEIMEAGYDPNGGTNAGITAASSTGITFTMYDDATNALKTIQYDVYDAYADGDNDIGRQVDGVKRAVLENLEAIEYFYTLENGNTTLAPTASDLSLDQIRTIQLSLLVRSSYPAKTSPYTGTYQSASGAVWGPFGDNFRRLLLRTTIQCRNIGL
jgi:type IV pilus assembly protein PilW